MQIDIRGQNVPVSDALVAHCLDRLHRALRPFGSRISRVQIVFVHLNGPRKGQGQACRLTVHLWAGSPVRFETRSEDYYQSASDAIGGIVRSIQRVLVRRREMGMGDGSPTLPAV